MPLFKNQVVPLKILSVSSDGNGVGKLEGQAVFVPFSAPNDELLVKIVRPLSTYAFGIIDSFYKPSPYRIEPDCSIFGKCGGCAFRHLTYEQELVQKQGFVEDSMLRLGKIDTPVSPILPSPQTDRYRNKVQLPVYADDKGGIHTGFYAGRSHRVIPCNDCMLQPEIFTQIAAFLCELFTKYKFTAYNEAHHTGLLRHIYLRHSVTSEKVMVCLVLNAKKMPNSQEIVKSVTDKFPCISSIIINANKEKTNVVLGKKCFTIYGDDVLHDTLSDVPVALDPLSFYQVNTLGAEQLYAIACTFAGLRQDDILLDLYCGTGTIGLSMASLCKKLIGVEVVLQAIESAIKNAEAMGIDNAEFLCADAAQAAKTFAEKGLEPNVVILDPPRKGCDEEALSAVCEMKPQKIVMVSCNPATAARDCAYFIENKYEIQAIQPVDMFPRTRHVECVILMSRIEK